jgi:hypothetical protein
MSSPADELATAVTREMVRAAEARWLTTGVVTAYTAARITATIDEASIGNICRVSTWATPAAGDVALFAIVRGTSSIHYVGIGKIT